MKTISLRVSDEDSKLIQSYVNINNLNLSAFVREAILDKIETDFNLDEERIAKARDMSKNEKIYDHTEVWDRLGV